MTALVPLGDRGFLAEFADDQAAASWASAVSAENWPGVLDVVPAYHRVGVHADPERINLDELEGRLRGLIVSEFAHSEGRLIVIPTLYEGEDLQEVASPVLTHRIITTFTAQSEGIDSRKIVRRLIEETATEET